VRPAEAQQPGALPPPAVPAGGDSTPPGAVEWLEVIGEGLHSISFRWGPAQDPESGISAYVFAMGSTPGAADLRSWQSLGNSPAGAAVTPADIGLQEGDSVYVSLAAINGAGLYGPLRSSDAVGIEWQTLGDPTGMITVAFAGDWRSGEVDSLRHFTGRMLPIISELYGPPAHSYTVTLAKDPDYRFTNVFYSGANEIRMFQMFPQLLTHELIHAYRDNVLLASDAQWHYSPVLSGFEESFAQGVSYACMNRYVELHPDDPIVPGWTSYGSSYDWVYDFENSDLLTTTDFWSDAGGTGIFWTRYEMGAAAINKILRERPAFARDFNAAYYASLNADHALRPTRELCRALVQQTVPAIEGWPSGEWVDRQRIFDCRVRPGRKVWIRGQPYPGWMEYIYFQAIQHYETFPNGSEWAYWDAASGTWQYHSLNDTPGHGVLRDAQGRVVWEKDLRLVPAENPPAFWGFGSAGANLSTDDDTEPWPGGATDGWVLGLHAFGLYTMEVRFGDVTERFPRLMGDVLRNTHGVYGAVLHGGDGWLFLDHEAVRREAPLAVQSGAFHGARAWASMPNPRTGSTDSRPGRVTATFVDTAGTVYRDGRNIDLGSWSGNQMFLFDVEAMRRVEAPLPLADAWRLDFGGVPVGGSGALRVRITNLSARTLRVDSLSAGDAGSFRVAAAGLPAQLARGDTLSVEVTFAPDSERAYEDSLRLWGNARAAIDLAGHGAAATGAPPEAGAEPVRFALEPNLPNPFNPATTIRYTLPHAARIDLSVYDAAGRRVEVLVRGRVEAGSHTVAWSARGLPSGIYFCRLHAGDRVATRKLVRLD
jgi:hypothetical protein